MKIHAIYRCTALLLFCLLPAGTYAAPSVDVIISANGTNIPGGGSGNTPNNNFINGLGFDHEVVVERDAATGQSTGRRQHKPIRIVKPIDKATPLLYKAMLQNEVIAGEFKFWRANPSTPAGGGGSLQQYYTVAITGGRITGIRDWKTNTRDLSADRAGDLEEVSFTYTSITWTWVDGGITHTDTWSSPP
jgi:type VI secretion system secreted protein Hcp